MTDVQEAATSTARAPAVDLSVVVPLFNEEASVDALHEEIARAVGALRVEHEIVFVDDGSRDATVARLKAIRSRDPRVRIVRLRRNYGQTPAMQAGFDVARGRVVVTMDGDLQNDPADIGRFLEGIDEGYDLVCGWRKDRKDKLVSRKLPSRIANRLISLMTGIKIRDNGCSLKAYRAEFVKRTTLYSEMHRFIPAMMSMSGCRYKEIVVHHRARRFGASKYGLSRTWKVFSDLFAIKMITGFTTRPSLWFVLLSMPFFALSLVFLALSAYHYWLRSGSASSVVYPSVTVLLVFASMHLLLVGMIAELVTRVGDYRETETIVTRADLESGGRR